MNFLGEYLYIVQERERTISCENVFKFGRTSQAPNKRMTGYPKNSRLWMTVIMQDTKTHEDILKKFFAKKYKARPDIGSESYEVDDVKNMMQDLWDYWKQNFVNPFSDSGDWHFKLRKDDIVSTDSDGTAHIELSKIGGVFIKYLIDNGWQFGSNNDIIIERSKYDAFCASVEMKTKLPACEFAADSGDDEKSDTVAVDLNDVDESIKPEIKPSKFVKQVKQTKKPVSVEQFVKLLLPHLEAKKLKPSDVNAKVHIGLTTNGDDVAVKQIELFNSRGRISVINNFSECENCVIPNNVNPNILHLSEAKLKRLNPIKKSKHNDYVLHIKSFEFSKCRKFKRWIEYAQVSFEVDE